MQKITLKNIPRNVWILGFVSLFTDTASKIIQSLLPLFLVSVLGVNLITIGTIEGIAESTASILKIFSGALSDYWGKRKQLAIAGYGLSALVVPIFALANSPLWVLIGRFGDKPSAWLRYELAKELESPLVMLWLPMSHHQNKEVQPMVCVSP